MIAQLSRFASVPAVETTDVCDGDQLSQLAAPAEAVGAEQQ